MGAASARQALPALSPLPLACATSPPALPRHMLSHGLGWTARCLGGSTLRDCEVVVVQVGTVRLQPPPNGLTTLIVTFLARSNILLFRDTKDHHRRRRIKSNTRRKDVRGAKSTVR
ncbi:hypothetical protein GALMADRAFT_883426 [Galerina marginata CBS 339.88]|uniref:Uncharacterized protein n=1 Tax=Galerina marginata (strain CBS 339.88) TaxID=685588 RepID=A0A067SK10_GALM3|nr:hypothetical protein GALMADRAFT_883426 [Galerina marginata CBS 339.88]